MSDGSGWTSQKLMDTIRKGHVYPLYFLYGDETFLIDDALQQLQEMALGEGLRDFNLNVYYGSDVDVEQVRDAIETLPMMAQVRVVVLKEAQELTDKEWESLMPIIDEPVPTTAFICVASKIDKRKKHIKRFIERGAVVEFKRPFDNQIPDWIVTIAKKHSIKLDRDAVDLIHQFVGSNLQDINAEVQKLAQFIGGSGKVATADDVLQVVSRIKVDSVFDLTDAIGHNDRARALYCLANLLDHGQNEVGVLSLVSRHVRILKLINDGMKEGLSGQRLSSRAGVAPYFLKSYIEQARHWNERKIDHTFQALLDTDRALKSSPVASHIWLENFIVRTCSN
jgi:DNA polymerase-3 subunit delta